MKYKLYCPHCDEFHLNDELEVDIESDYVQCKASKQEIRTWKTDSENTRKWRKSMGLEDFW